MELIPEDAHPADEILNMYAPGYVSAEDGPPTSYGAYNGSQYKAFDAKAHAVVQQMPGKAVPTFNQKVGMLNNPGVQLPDLKKVSLVPSKEKDGPGVEQIAANDARTRRQLYEVTMAGKMRRGIAGSAPQEFDTAAIKSTVAKQEYGAGWLGETQEDSERFRDLSIEWMLKSLIWVAAIEKGRLGVTFYSSVGRLGKFHHSSFTSGGALLAAGEWIVEDGALKKISGNSGHYRPTINELHRAVLYMAPAWQTDTEVMLYNKKARNWEYVPVNLFKADPSGGGKYAAHAAEK